ncbi:MAG: DUF2500 domain-containing protein [Erysipelotrichaceae bacterium]|nr:DUF2500 domain-containing protein [Erysipelotrichaceae bacterium]
MIFNSGLLEIMFISIFFIVVGMFVYTIFNGIMTWNKNNHSPRLVITATVVSKCTQMDYHH